MKLNNKTHKTKSMTTAHARVLVSTQNSDHFHLYHSLAAFHSKSNFCEILNETLKLHIVRKLFCLDDNH